MSRIWDGIVVGYISSYKVELFAAHPEVIPHCVVKSRGGRAEIIFVLSWFIMPNLLPRRVS